MSPTCIALLKDRAVASVAGPDAAAFLQGLVTNDVEHLAPGRAAYAALLTPQGKILFDMIVVREAEGFLIETARERTAELVKRLGFYRLRAKVEIADRSGDLYVAAAWGGPLPPGVARSVYSDPRLAALGERLITEASSLPTLLERASASAASEAAYHAHRIAHGVPEGGRDFAFGDAFPHEADLDQLQGLDFKKGCYVGQEIVARMEHRGTARKRIVMIEAAVDLPAPGTEVRAAEAVIGTLGSSTGPRGLALVRLDRAAEARAKGVPITAGGIALTLVRPPWATFALEPSPMLPSQGPAS